MRGSGAAISNRQVPGGLPILPRRSAAGKNWPQMWAALREDDLR